MKVIAKNNLLELTDLLLSMNEEEYSMSCNSLSGGTVGQHIRHILEFYQCLMCGYERGEVNYDNRSRDLRIERDRFFAVQVIEQLLLFIDKIDLDRGLTLIGNWDSEKLESTKVISNYKRELAYNIEHSIHHQALIKVGLIALNAESLVNESFGVAPATMRFRSS